MRISSIASCHLAAGALCLRPIHLRGWHAWRLLHRDSRSRGRSVTRAPLPSAALRGVQAHGRGYNSIIGCYGFVRPSAQRCFVAGEIQPCCSGQSQAESLGKTVSVTSIVVQKLYQLRQGKLCPGWPGVRKNPAQHATPGAEHSAVESTTADHRARFGGRLRRTLALALDLRQTWPCGWA